MKQKGIAPIIIILLIAVVAAGAYLFGTKNILKLPTSLSLPLISPSSTTDPTASWKTYTSKVGVEFKYPNDWTQSQEQQPNSSLITLKSPKGTLLNLSIVPEGFGFPCLKEISEEKIILNNKVEATKTILETVSGDECGTSEQMETILVLFTLTNNNYLISYLYPIEEKNTERILIDQILSTFKFLETPNRTP